ncbi:MAG: flagellar hook assembly protein FlgD [Methylococcales bacterium]|nr:flagellar hook assembly protein FlgD [Methylococcales bacterium]MDD5753556.1 flagellar hook assembly protein FlgD [Methylococcales bacterium]
MAVANTSLYDKLNKSTSEASAASKAFAEAESRKIAKNKTSLGQAEFLKLMTTQMTHQDPNNPMQNGEFLSQMAQFGTVSGIQDLQASFANFSSSISSDQALQAASLVGRDVTITSDQGVLAAGGDISGTVNLTSSTPDLQVAVTDASTGELIKTLDLGNQSSGNVPFSWDGTNTAGTLASPGAYKIVASAPVDGKNTAFTTDINSRVGSVVMANGTKGMQINLAGGNTVDFSQVKQIL